jgi:opacity protein-like surface antigen
MTITKSVKNLGAAVLICAGVATEARADGFISPFMGVNFGGDVGGTLNSAASKGKRAAFGAAVGFMGGGVFGVELDVAYTNKFYGEGAMLADNSLLTVMPALILGVPVGGQRGLGIRPYATAGVGMVRRNLKSSGVNLFDGSDLAYELGGGVMGYFSDHVGLRADYRYVRNFEVDEVGFTDIDLKQGTFDFSRAAIGLLLRF